ncbi:hypothetical protein SKAU_G00220440 [Synaphobranchus kaupii]|uniref:C2H2-type domain-containing protein n=1 Tax=Synaphobranchus kaupii TaxID=118154 RepID=A0A9Q1FAU9_SYNKA|nr:hypothetical protein SKAU_G00220440 [Synaphobranchus kaupii]
MYFGNACQNAILPTLVRPPLPTVQPTLDMKQFLSFPLDATATVNLFPNFSANMIGISRTEQSSPIGSWKTGLSGRRLCVSMDPVQKAIINHTFGIPPLPKRKHVVSCSVCQLRFNSQSQASAHYKGTKHAKKLKSLEAPKCKQKAAAVATETTNKDTPKSTYPPGIPTSADSTDNAAGAGILPPSPPTTGAMLSGLSMATGGDSKDTSTKGIREVPSYMPAVKPAPAPSPSPSPSPSPPSETEIETEEEKAKRLLYCSLCKVAVNSGSQLEAHNSGTKHKTMLEARSGSGTIKSFPRPGVKGKLPQPTKSATGLQNKTFHCEICDVHVNSETQLKQHISSRRHKDRAAGKPPKPKYSPYNKTQRGPSGQPAKVEVRKDLGPSITARMLPNHLQLAVAAAAATAPPFSLRPNHAAALFQTQTLPAALLRPAPGPIRTSHTPLLFSPY